MIPPTITSAALALSLLPGLGLAQNSTRNQFHNPILPGAHPDPSCIHIPEEETFFCASSTFNIFPGIPIHASKDLQTWRLIGHVLNRQSQLPVLSESVGSTSGIWAPTLRRHNGTFYLVTTMVHDKKPEDDPKRWDNIIFQTTDIWNESSWSNAIHFDFQGYDTSPYWDEEGTSYVVGAHAWRVSPGIHLAKVDLSTGVLKSNFTSVWNGTGGQAPEGPHIYDKDGYKYLLVAEGGTGAEHMVTMARSKSLYGPYEINSGNPVMTNTNTSSYFQAIGHADVFQDIKGQWWGVSLAVRSGPEYKTWPMGRETILTNVTWANGSFPTFQHPIVGSMTGWQLPGNNQSLPASVGPLVDQGDDNLQFAPGSKIPSYFVYWRPPIPSSYTISPPEHPNSLRLTPSFLNLTGLDGNSPGPEGQTFISRRQVHTLFTYSVDISIANETRGNGEEAGVSLFLSQNHHARLGLKLPLETPVPHFCFEAQSYIPVPKSFCTRIPVSWHDSAITFQIKAVNTTHYSFAAGPANKKEGMRVFEYVPGEIISWGFTGALLGVYATSNGLNGTTPAYVSNWNYKGEGQVRDNPGNGTMVTIV